MKKADLEEMEAAIMAEVVKRRQLGGFDANAETILKLTEWVYKLTQHAADAAKK